MAADIFSSSGALAGIRSTWEMVSFCMFLHSFDWAGQLAAFKAMVELAAGAGSWILGGLTASVNAREHESKWPFVPERVKRRVFIQSRESFRRLWDEVREATGVEVKVWAEYDDGESESKKSTEGGAGNIFGSLEQKLQYMIEII